VPATNEVLSEMARRGVSRDKLLPSLQLLGAEVPGPVVRMLTWAVAQHLPVKVLSDCNSVFIGHILAGARLGRAVRDGALEVVTNGATFERLMGDTGDAAPGLGAAAAAATAPASAAKAAGGAGYKLVVQPRHPASAAPHGCPLCPANLCKGAELRRLRTAAPLSAGGGWGRVVYAGDGANDICPALALGPRDVVLARAGEALARYAAEAPADPNARQLRAAVHVWHNHEQLARLVREHTSA
jgi:Putative Phosphatase